MERPALQRAELDELRQLVTNLTLASAVLTQTRPTPPDNVIALRPEAT